MNSLHPHSQQARDITSLWWWMMTGAWIGLGVVVLLLVAGFIRRRRRGTGADADDERTGWAVVLAGGIFAPIVVLVTLFVVSDIFVIRTTQAPAAGKTAMTIEVVGHQWFWEIRYPGTTAVTANELHLPVHTPVEVVVTTADVIHSFWVPELNRKIDAIPGRRNRILLDADRPGRYRGQCAEFCGLQHAHMGLLVFAEPQARFRHWLAHEAAAAEAPGSAPAQQGLEAFTAGPCASCHTIRGTAASGDTGPDLTHVGARTTLGAVTIPNRPAELAEWIVDSQHFKPGNQMPNVELGHAQVRDLVAYLEGLK